MADSYTGEIRIFAGSFAPVGWLLCNGSLLKINDYQPLYALIGTTYGGDGVTTFALPDFRGKFAIGTGLGAGLTQRNLGQAVGAEAVALTTAQMPAHTHSWQVTTATGTSPTPNGNLLAHPVNSASGAAAAEMYLPPASVLSANIVEGPANMVTSEGGSQPHANIMPYMALNYIISTNGIFPDLQ